MKKNYNIQIVKKAITQFNWESKNKKEAKKTALEVIENTDILKHQDVHFDYETEIIIKKGNKNGNKYRRKNIS